MDRQPVVMPADASVQRALDEFFWRYRWPWFPVVDQAGHFIGLIEQHSVDRIDETAREITRASDLVEPNSPTTAQCATTRRSPRCSPTIEIRDYGSLMAIDDHGVLSGVVTIEQVQRALRDAIARRPPRERRARRPAGA